MERARLTGSSAPQRALVALERLAARGSTLARDDALLALERDPLAAFATPAVDDRLLEATLARIDVVEHEESDTARRARSLRRRPRPPTAGGARRLVDALAGSEGAPAAVRPAVARAHAQRGTIRVPAAGFADQATPIAGEPSALAPIAQRVPGGVAAVATPVMRTADRAAAPAREHELVLEAVLGRVSAATPGAVEPTLARPRRARLDDVASAERASEEPTAPVVLPERRASTPPGTAPTEAELVELTTVALGRREHRVPPPTEPSTSSQGLAELVRRWESTPRAAAAEVRARRREAAAAEVDDTTLAEAVERLLLGELRRSGIEVELG